MPRDNTRGRGDELVQMGNYVPTNCIGNGSEFTSDHPTFPRAEPILATQGRNAAAGAGEQRRLGGRERGGNMVDEPSVPPPSNSPFRENGTLLEDEIPTSELIRKVVIHIDRPMENLPELTLPELKLIGRRVSFNAETLIGKELLMMKYIGLVGAIDKDTVMLIHVFRFRVNDNGPHVMQPDQALGFLSKRSIGAGLTSAGLETFTWALEPGGEAALPPPADTGGSIKRIYGKLLGQRVGIGPIPFVTFSRTSISRVNFAQDPANGFFSLFSDPSRRYFDMQCLRMFCRRYIVHTVQKNNPHQIPLRAFIVYRCNCPNIDERLLVKVTREEIEHLVNVERAVKRAKKKAATISRTALREYVPPSTAFSRTGVLYLTHIPQQTFTIGLVVIIFSLLVLFFFTFLLLCCTRVVIVPYIRQSRVYVYSEGAICLAAGMLTVVHSLLMRIFSPCSVRLSGVRFLFSVLGLASSFMLVIVLVHNLKHDHFDSYIRYDLPIEELLEYYRQKGCEGYTIPCIPQNKGMEDYKKFCFGKDTTKPPCGNYLEREYSIALNPLLCVVLLLMIFVCFEEFMHFKLLYVTRMLLSRSR